MGLADDEGHPYTGYVNFLDNQLDPATGTLQVRGIFQNTDRMLRPGLFVRVRLPIGEPYRALLVAEEALGTDQGQKYVYVVDDDNKAAVSPHRNRQAAGRPPRGAQGARSPASGWWSVGCSACGPAQDG